MTEKLNTLFAQTLKLIAQTISVLDGFKPMAGVNISNWDTQIMSNGETHYEIVVTLTLKDSKPMRLTIPKDFKPVTKSPDMTSGYIGDLRNGNISDALKETLTLLGYFTGSLILGKIPSVVNSGRGLLVEKMLKDLNVIDFTLVIKQYTGGGKDPLHDLTYTYPQLKSLIRFFSIRASEIEKLEKKSGHTSGRVNEALKRDNLKVEMID